MTILKTITADLQNDVVNIYDQNKTTIAGFTYAQVVNGVPVLAPPLVKWVDVFSDSGEVIIYANLTENGRLFGITAPSGGQLRIVYFDFDVATGTTVYKGKIVALIPNTASTAHTIRGFKVDDADVTNVKLIYCATGSVTVNSGLFCINKVPLTDFVSIGFPTIPFGVGSNVKGVYFLQDPSAIGAGQLNTVSAGMILDRDTKIAYVHNGSGGAHSFFKYNYSNIPDCPVNTVTMTIASPCVVTNTGHTLNNNDQVVFSTTGALPTGIVAGTVYFVRNSVAGVSHEVSATSGGASINTTGSQSGVHSISRAYGITGSSFIEKTGLLPALTGTLLNINCESSATPLHSVNAGAKCVFFATTTNLYLGKISELTSGVTTWPSLITANLLGTTNQVTAPVAVNATWDTLLDRAVFTTSTTKIIAKKMVNNLIEDIFGLLNNDYLEGLLPTNVVTQFGAITLTEFNSAFGWTYLIGSTVGQRGIIALNSGSSYRYGSTYIITKVFDTPNSLSYAGVALATQLNNLNSVARISYRQSGFGSASGGWTVLPLNNLLNGVVPSAQIQFKIEFDPTDDLANNPPACIELYLAFLEATAMSDNWRGSVSNSSQPLDTPFYVAFRLQKTYLTAVPTMFVTVVDDSGAISRYDTVTHAAQFSYSPDNGTTWLPLGTIPNTALLTELRLNIIAPSGNPITAGILEY